MAKKRKQKKQKRPMYYPQTCGEVFHRHIVPAVNALLQFPDAHPLALQGMFNAAELAYKCAATEHGGESSGDPYGWLQWLFPSYPGENDNVLHRLTDQFVSPLRTAGFIAPGVGLAGHTRKGKPITAPWRVKGDIVMVSPQAFWAVVYERCVEVFEDRDVPYTEINKPWNFPYPPQ